MRRQRLRSAHVEPSAERPGRARDRGPLRQAQWSSYYHRFFGRVRPGDRIPGGFEPLSLDDSTRTLYDACFRCEDRIQRHQRRRVARRCVSQMLLYGYRPSERRQLEFDALTRAAALPEADPPTDPEGRITADRAKDFLISWGEREFTPWDMLPQQRLPIEQELQEAGPETHMVSRPTSILHVQGAFLVDKQVYLRTDVSSVSRLVNPENWEQMGEFFARTFREGDEAHQAVEAKAEPWRGVLREDFIASWNGFTTNVFKQRLKVDYTVTPELARTDYALMYEEDDQVTVNEGFLEVRHEATLPSGWIAGRMQKRLKFTSSMLNLLCPALLSMLLDSKAGGFNNFLEQTAQAGAPSV